MRNKKPSFLGLALKSLALIIALAGTVFAIYSLKTNHTDDLMASLGLSGEQLSWCSDRLEKMVSLDPKNQWTLFEEENQWLLEIDGAKVPLSYIEIEKWLARYCYLSIKSHQSSQPFENEFTGLAKAYFMDGQTVLIYSSGEGLYQINEKIFYSKEFEKGLRELHSFTSTD